MAVALEVLIILGLILANGIFAMAEIAIVSSRKARLEQQADDGRAGAAVALSLASSPGQFLSTVQIGITAIAVFTGAVGGATLAEPLALLLAQVPALEPYSEAISVTIVVVAISFVSLVVGELAPKRIALANPETIASRLSRPMRRLSRIAGPLVRLLDWSTATLLHAIGWRASEEAPVTGEEIEALVQQATDAGVFEESEQDMMESVLRLGDRLVSSAMTPRPDVVWLDPDDPVEHTLGIIEKSGFRRFPVARDDLDNLIGIVETNDLLHRALRGDPYNLAESAHPAQIVPDTMPLLDLLQMSRQTGTQMYLVADEFGGVQGILTDADLLYALVGDIQSSTEDGANRAVRREDGSWLLSGRMPVPDLQRLLDIDDLPEDEEGQYHTLAGFVLSRLGHIPVAAETFEWSGCRFEVVDMDGHRVDKVLVTPLGRRDADDPDMSPEI